MKVQELTGIIKNAEILANKLFNDRAMHVKAYLQGCGINASYPQVAQFLVDSGIPLSADEPDEDAAVTAAVAEFYKPEPTKSSFYRPLYYIKCRQCGGSVELDTDSFETNIEDEMSDTFALSAKVTGYCTDCKAELIYSTYGVAEIDIKF